MLGTVHTFARNHDNARMMLERAITLDSNSAWAHSRLGWLEVYADRPKSALPHFERLADIATIPRTISRAHYWLARTHARLGNEQIARLNAEAAAGHGHTYYGQLARDALGLKTKVVGVVSENAQTAKLSAEAGRLIETNSAA